MYLYRRRTTVDFGEKKFPRNFEHSGRGATCPRSGTLSQTSQEHEVLLVDRSIVTEEHAFVRVIRIHVNEQEDACQQDAWGAVVVVINAQVTRIQIQHDLNRSMCPHEPGE